MLVRALCCSFNLFKYLYLSHLPELVSFVNFLHLFVIRLFVSFNGLHSRLDLEQVYTLLTSSNQRLRVRSVVPVKISVCRFIIHERLKFRYDKQLKFRYDILAKSTIVLWII